MVWSLMYSVVYTRLEWTQDVVLRRLPNGVAFKQHVLHVRA